MNKNMKQLNPRLHIQDDQDKDKGKEKDTDKDDGRKPPTTMHGDDNDNSDR